MSTKNSGNALFMILIAVFLLGGLTVLLARTSSTTDETGSTEQLALATSQIVHVMADVDAAVQKLLSSGCSENQISFDNAIDVNYVNPNAPSDKSCHVFDPAGAGLTWPTIPVAARSEKYNDPVTASNLEYERYNFTGTNGVQGIGTGISELVARVPVNLQACVKLNQLMNAIPASPPNVDSNGIHFGNGSKFKGTYTTPNAFNAYAGYKRACEQDQSNGNVYFFRVVLIPR